MSKHPNGKGARNGHDRPFVIRASKMPSDRGQAYLSTLADDSARPANVRRPKTRGDCVDAERPCPFVGCRYSLVLDVDPDTGTIRINHPGLELDDLAETCALDVAERGPHRLERIGELLNVTRERVRQLETTALRNSKRTALERGL